MMLEIINLKVGDKIYDPKYDQECVVLEIMICKRRPIVKVEYIPEGGQVIASMDMFWPIDRS